MRKEGTNPIIYNNEKYIDPSDYNLKEYDGNPDMMRPFRCMCLLLVKMNKAIFNL